MLDWWILEYGSKDIFELRQIRGYGNVQSGNVDMSGLGENQF